MSICYNSCIEWHCSEFFCTCCKFGGNSSMGVSATSLNPLSSAGSYISPFILIHEVGICSKLSQCVAAKSVLTLRQSAGEFAVSTYRIRSLIHNVVRSTCRASERSLRFLWPLGR